MKPTAYPYQPIPERGTLGCFLLALFMHLLLGILLYYGVHWQSSPPVGVEAELWDAIPETTAPPPQPVQPQPVTPAPTLRAEEEADIALRRQKRREGMAAREAAREQRDLRARQAREQAARKEAHRNEDVDARAKRGAAANVQHQSELERLQALAGRTAASNGAGTGGTASPGYADRVRRRVKPNIIFTEDVAGNPAAVVAVQLAPDGSLRSARLTQSSGNAAWDSAVLRAVERSAPLPRDENGIAPGSITITFTPKA